jgi:HlyD family secretion protein
MKNQLLIKWITLFALSMLLLSACAGANANAATDTGTGTVSAIEVTDSISTSGNLGADQLSSLTWNTSGTVAQVNVKAGDIVKAGDVLAILGEDSVPSSIITAQSDLASAQRDLDDLLNSQAALATAQLAVANAEQTVSDAQKEYDSLNFPRASDALINNTEAQITQAKRAVAMASDRYRLLQRKPDGDPNKTAAELALTNAQLNLNELQATYNWYVGDPTSIDADLAAATLSSAKATLADAQREYELLKNGPDPVDLAAAKARMQAAQATIDSMKIIAPFDGEILTVQTAAGNPVNNGSAAFEIVNRATLKVETMVDETSIAAVTQGDKAEISMDLLPGVTLTGKVAVISAIGSTVNGLVKYTVTIGLDPTTEPVRFGATTNVILYTSEPHTVLAVPVAAIQSDTKGEYVLVVNADGNTRRVDVQSGDLSGSQVTLPASGDLKEGDLVQLTTASSSSSSSSKSNNSGGGLQIPGGGPGGGL